MSDVRDILELDRPNTPEISKAAILGIRSNVPKKKEKEGMRRPEGMHRELFALLYSTDGTKELPPLLQSDTLPQQGYKSTKARLGMRRVRPWALLGFCNPARKDGAMLFHWRRVADQNKEYPFAQFDKHIEILQYTESEYSDHLSSELWSRSETDALMQLCRQFDLRWPIIHDRWPRRETAGGAGGIGAATRSIEDIKERYYQITNTLKKARGLTGLEGKQVHYDADLERRRKLQLTKLWDRTPKQIEEEQTLISELRRIEARKKERERKTQDLQKLIAGGEGGDHHGGGAGGHTGPRKYAKHHHNRKKLGAGLNKMTKQDSGPTNSGAASGLSGSLSLTEGIRFPELRLTGVALRSHILKLPASLGQKKLKAIEHLLSELSIEHNPMPVAEVCSSFNELRSDLVVMYELRTVLLNYVFELQTLRHQYETLRPQQSLVIPPSLQAVGGGEESPSKSRGISDMLDSVANAPGTPNRKRKAALEQSNILKKIKART